MKIIDTIWFGAFDGTKTIGIVLVDYDEDGKLKAKIGLGDGLDTATDAHKIALVGSHFPLLVAMLLIYSPHHNLWTSIERAEARRNQD